MEYTSDISISQPTLAELATKLGTTEEAILSHCRKAELVDARCMIVAILMNRPHVRQQDVALMLDISQAAVSKLLTRHGYMLSGFGDACYSHRWQTLLSSIKKDLMNTTQKQQNHVNNLVP